jgi:hypothetical protein
MDKHKKKSPRHNLEQDTPELAALVRQGLNGCHASHKKGDIRKILARLRSRLQRRIDR